MEITDIRVKLISRGNEKLKAFCNITLSNCFVVRELKIIEGPKGIFVAMPSRKITDHCIKCGCKNSILAKFCSECGVRLERFNQNAKSATERVRAYSDIVHPITLEMRDAIQNKVIGAYRTELERSKEPGYVAPVNIEVT